jgi:two-component system CheB/CheR fusion protein
VRDDGIGIPEEMVPKVFDLFTQVDGSLERSQGGLGIGLTLVRRLVEMHGGTVYATSEGPGRGSEFTIRLPAASVVQLAKTDTTKGHLARSSPRSCASRRVLIVDDNMDAAESLATLLGLLNHDVRTAHDGPSALKLAARFLPQVIVLDIGLPGVDGYELAAQLRRQPELGQPLLIALTGYGQEDDRQRAHAAGFDHHLTKPADLDALQQLIGAG